MKLESPDRDLQRCTTTRYECSQPIGLAASCLASSAHRELLSEMHTVKRSQKILSTRQFVVLCHMSVAERWLNSEGLTLVTPIKFVNTGTCGAHSSFDRVSANRHSLIREPLFFPSARARLPHHTHLPSVTFTPLLEGLLFPARRYGFAFPS